MAYTLKGIVDAIKREARAGVVGDYTEQYTTDIVNYWNRWSQQVWAYNNWDWNKVPISFTLLANTVAETSFAATIGELIVLGIQGDTGELASFTEKEYRKWRKQADISTAGGVIGYVLRGYDATGNLKVLFVNTPTSDVVIEGEGKLKWVKIALADVAADNAIAYFPDHVIETLIMGVAGAFMTAINDPRGPAQETKALNWIEVLRGVRTNPAEDVTTPPPDYIRFQNRNRGGTRVV